MAPALYAATAFLSALLLFVVQPMITKMVLPKLGGAPTVWSVAMVFFQASLLAGYAYAHLLIRRLPLGLGALVEEQPTEADEARCKKEKPPVQLLGALVHSLVSGPAPSLLNNPVGDLPIGMIG